MEEDMAIRIEQNLFYVESKGLSLILENRDGYLMLKHLGRPIPSYHFSNTVHEKDHAQYWKNDRTESDDPDA